PACDACRAPPAARPRRRGSRRVPPGLGAGARRRRTQAPRAPAGRGRRTAPLNPVGITPTGHNFRETTGRDRMSRHEGPNDTTGLLAGRVTLVTGASRGIGAVTAKVLAAAGAPVVLAARDEDRLSAIAKEIADGGGEAVAVRADVADPVDVEHLIVRTLDAFGRLDAAFNNAGDARPPTPL